MRKKNTAASLDHRRFAVAGLIRIWRSDRDIYLPISKIARLPRSSLRTLFEQPPAEGLPGETGRFAETLGAVRI